jgi:hypothetical protein
MSAALSLLGRHAGVTLFQPLECARHSPSQASMRLSTLAALPALARIAPGEERSCATAPQQLTNLRHFLDSAARQHLPDSPVSEQLRHFHRSEAGYRSPGLGEPARAKRGRGPGDFQGRDPFRSCSKAGGYERLLF